MATTTGVWKNLVWRHMTRGRILWTDVITHTGRWMRVVNVHQATSKDKGLQGVVLKALERQLGQHENVMGIMGGGFNANANGDRTGYAESNKQHLVELTDNLRILQYAQEAPSCPQKISQGRVTTGLKQHDWII